MRTFAQKHSQPQKPISSSLARLNRTPLGLDVGLTAAALPRVGHDFSQIPVYPPTAGAIQTKLAINKPGDEYEQEADQVAHQVMRIPEAAASGRADAFPDRVLRRTRGLWEAGAEVQIRRNMGASPASGEAVPPVVPEVLRSSGQALDAAARRFMEPRFGYDFSQVRVHTDARAAESAKSVNALAYAVGRNIVFGAGQYAPHTSDGRRMLAHELTHVIQQTGATAVSTSTPSIQTSPSPTLSGVVQRQEEKPAEKPDPNKEGTIAIAKSCPDLDEAVKRWLYLKAEPIILSRYRGLSKVVAITALKTWKVPSQWGELDMDVYYTKISEEAPPEEILDQLDKGEKWHVKLIAKFQPDGTGGLRVDGELIDWLDGHPITLRSWQGEITLIKKGESCKAKVTDVVEKERPPAPSRTKRQPRKATG